MNWSRFGITCAAVVMLSGFAAAQDRSSDPSLREIKHELQRLREQREQDRQRIEELEEKLKGVERASEQKEEEQKKASSTLDRILPELRSLRPGGDRFLLVGYGFGQYHWDRDSSSNSFSAGFNPIFLFRPTDWVLFDAELEVKLPEDAETEVNLEFAQANILLTDYATLVAGKSLLPFGEFVERLHPPWINKLVTHPLPFREGDEGGLLPFAAIGAQLRGGVPLGYGSGATVDYTVYIANSPHFTSNSALSGQFTFNNNDVNHGKAYGARLGVQPLPIEQGWGRLRLGVSTFDGKWNGDDDTATTGLPPTNGDLWFTSWGLDTVYQRGPAEIRGEYVFTRRSMPSNGPDKREGWYVQAAYKLAEIGVPYLERTEVVGRYSGQNQREATEDLVPHPRQISLGVDYWFTPSIVWKLEYDRDIPRDAPNNDEIQTQIAVGF